MSASGARRILMVDDDVEVANSLSELLRLMGHQVHTAYSGAAALSLAQDMQPEVVIVDLVLPDLDGREVARRLRQQHTVGTLVLIALTGRRAAQSAVASGNPFDHELLKPVDVDALEALLTSGPRL